MKTRHIYFLILLFISSSLSANDLLKEIHDYKDRTVTLKDNKNLITQGVHKLAMVLNSISKERVSIDVLRNQLMDNIRENGPFEGLVKPSLRTLDGLMASGRIDIAEILSPVINDLNPDIGRTLSDHFELPQDAFTPGIEGFRENLINQIGRPDSTPLRPSENPGGADLGDLNGPSTSPNIGVRPSSGPLFGTPALDPSASTFTCAVGCIGGLVGGIIAGSGGGIIPIVLGGVGGMIAGCSGACPRDPPAPRTPTPEPAPIPETPGPKPADPETTDDDPKSEGPVTCRTNDCGDGDTGTVSTTVRPDGFEDTGGPRIIRRGIGAYMPLINIRPNLGKMRISEYRR